MSGFQELLVILLIVFVIVFMPRIMPRKPEPRIRSARPRKMLTGKLRLGTALSVMYLAGAAAWFSPWKADPAVFLYAGAGPVLAGWLAYWVAMGFRRR